MVKAAGSSGSAVDGPDSRLHPSGGIVKGPDPISLTAGSSSVRLPRPKLALYEIFPFTYDF
ncbi:hypothetical protein F2Q68_00039608 [Brassica cretica]|nr:hypothetical protein F2Q68_00039608 [Brassica cretica]